MEKSKNQNLNGWISTKSLRNLKRKKIILILILLSALNAGSYIFMRHTYLLVHTCSYVNGNVKASDDIVPTVAGPGYDIWFLATFFVAYVASMPLMFLEKTMHQYDMLPSSCPWN